jgi:transketolase
VRQAFSDVLVALAKADPSVLLLTGDHGYALFDAFRSECPDQYINAGIAEQNMVGMAAGLARAGFRPFVYGLSAFVPVRVVEQIKLDVAHDNLPVIFVGDGAGLVYSHLGTSHQSTEDIACTRAIPNLAILSPADRHELAAAMHAAYQSRSPVYLRMGKSDRGDVHPGPVGLGWGAPLQVRQGTSRIAIFATGSMVAPAIRLATEPWLAASVWSVPSIKPADRRTIGNICAMSHSCIVMEEHSIYGGLGGLICEIAAETAPLPILRLGVEDRFSEHCGSYEYLLTEHGLDEPALRQRMKSFLDRLRQS